MEANHEFIELPLCFDYLVIFCYFVNLPFRIFLDYIRLMDDILDLPYWYRMESMYQVTNHSEGQCTKRWTRGWSVLHGDTHNFL